MKRVLISGQEPWVLIPTLKIYNFQKSNTGNQLQKWQKSWEARGQWGNLDISNSRKPLPPWAGGTQGRRCCYWNPEAVVTWWKLELQWVHLEGVGAMEEMQPLSQNWGIEGWREYPGSPLPCPPIFCQYLTLVGSSWHLAYRMANAACKGQPFLHTKQRKGTDGSEDQQAETGPRSKFCFLITSVYQFCISLESRSSHIWGHPSGHVLFTFFPKPDTQTSLYRIFSKPPSLFWFPSSGSSLVCLLKMWHQMFTRPLVSIIPAQIQRTIPALLVAMQLLFLCGLVEFTDSQDPYTFSMWFQVFPDLS